jgi:hypothetical protein
VFGSRKIQGVASKVETSRLLISRAGANSVPVPGLCAALSEIYAVDMFLGNVDRHDENFVAIRDGQSYLLIPIDFGHSLFWNRSLDVFPSSVQPTRRYGLEIRSQHGFDVRAANAIIDRIAALPSSTISGILSATPSDWLSDRERSEFEGWWSLGGPTAKLESLRRGLSDGTLLSSQLFVLLPTPSGGKALTLV